MIRHAEIVAVVGSMVLAGGLSAWLDRRRDARTRSEWEGLRTYELRHGGVALAATVVTLAVLAGARSLPAAGYDPTLFPVSAVQSLRAAGVRPRGPVFAPDIWGGYLILEWPEARVFVDGRSDMYGDDFMTRYVELYDARPGWEERLRNEGVEWALLPPEAPLARAMQKSLDWNSWAEHEPVTVFTRAGAGAPVR
jgi:hypothetical protein